MFNVSIIIVTRNRSGALRQTLDSLAQVQVPPSLEAELVLTDNGSTDTTKEIARTFDAPHLSIRYLYKPRPGKVRALNAALQHARGDILLFTDDDVRVPPDWITRMTAPIRTGRADAVAGGVVLAPHLRRPWMTPQNTNVLATTAILHPERPERMVGANMAFAREVLQKVPAFDPELGPGTEIGLGEETLFSMQLRRAGFRIVSAFDVAVEHHCDPGRLSRAAYQAAWKSVGREQAYIARHWRHEKPSRLRIYAALALKWIPLMYRRLIYAAGKRSNEGLSMEESERLRQLSYQRQFLRERRRPHNYARRGLVKQQGERPLQASTSFAEKT